MPGQRIVLGLDGSEGSEHACRWCAALAHDLGADVVAVYAMELPAYPLVTYEGLQPVPIGADVLVKWQEERRTLVESTWCAPLRKAGVTYDVVLQEGNPSSVIMETADSEKARFIVVGRRGTGGFSELALGSVSHQLTHHAHRPVIVVPAHER